MRLLARRLAVCLAVAGAGAAAAETSVDVNIITGFDISQSVDPAHHRRQLAGLAAALRSPGLIAAILRGSLGRVGLSVYAWHHQRFAVLPWTIVGSSSEAEAAARRVEERLSVNLHRESYRHGEPYIGRLTDLSRALDHAAVLLAEAPVANRAMVNIIGNGPDNMGEEAGAARDRLLASGVTVNALVLDGTEDAEDYFRNEVIGGPGTFLVVGDSSLDLGEVLLRKLLGDLMAAAGH